MINSGLRVIAFSTGSLKCSARWVKRTAVANAGSYLNKNGEKEVHCIGLLWLSSFSTQLRSPKVIGRRFWHLHIFKCNQAETIFQISSVWPILTDNVVQNYLNGQSCLNGMQHLKMWKGTSGCFFDLFLVCFWLLKMKAMREFIMSLCILNYNHFSTN